MNQISPLAFVHPEAKLGDNNIIGPFCYIDKNTVMGDNNNLQNSVTIHTGARENVTISRGTASKGTTKVGSGNLLMECVHVAHDCVLGSGCIIGNATKFAGEVTIDDNAIVSSTVLCHQFCRIGGYVMIQGGCRFSQDIPPYIIAGKDPTKYCGINLIGLRRRGFSNEKIQMIHEAYRLLYSKGLMAEGIEEIRKNLPECDEINYIIDFVQSSKRGIVR